MQALRAVHRFLTQGEIGLRWLLLFRWAALIGGGWTIASQPGQGTRLRVQWPFQPVTLEEG